MKVQVLNFRAVLLVFFIFSGFSLSFSQGSPKKLVKHIVHHMESLSNGEITYVRRFKYFGRPDTTSDTINFRFIRSLKPGEPDFIMDVRNVYHAAHAHGDDYVYDYGNEGFIRDNYGTPPFRRVESYFDFWYYFLGTKPAGSENFLIRLVKGKPVKYLSSVKHEQDEDILRFSYAHSYDNYDESEEKIIDRDKISGNITLITSIFEMGKDIQFEQYEFLKQSYNHIDPAKFYEEISEQKRKYDDESAKLSLEDSKHTEYYVNEKIPTGVPADISPETLVKRMENVLNDLRNGEYSYTGKTKEPYSDKVETEYNHLRFSKPAAGKSPDFMVDIGKNFLYARFHDTCFYYNKLRKKFESLESAEVFCKDWKEYFLSNLDFKSLKNLLSDPSYKRTFLVDRGNYYLRFFDSTGASRIDIKNAKHIYSIDTNTLIPGRYTENHIYSGLLYSQTCEIKNAVYNQLDTTLFYKQLRALYAAYEPILIRHETALKNTPGSGRPSYSGLRNKDRLLDSLSVAPEWLLNDMNGNPFTLSEEKKKLILLDFWYVGCLPCQKTIPVLVKLQEKYGKYGFEVLGLNDHDSELASIKTAIENGHINYPIILNAKVLGSAYRIHAFPTTYLLNEKKQVIFSAQGYSDNFENTLEALIRKQLNINN